MRAVELIERKLQEAVANPDVEVAHLKADELLCDLALLLMEHLILEDSDEAACVQRIRETFLSHKKGWYYA